MSWYENDFNGEKVSVDPDEVVRTLNALMNKKHTSRIFYYLNGLTEESKKNIPDWMAGNIDSWLKGEYFYLSNHFSPVKIKKRIEGLIEGVIWKGFININGGYQSLDILLHTLDFNGELCKVIERVYYRENGYFGEENFFNFIRSNNISLKVPEPLGCFRDGNLCFFVQKYIAAARHPTRDEMSAGLKLKIMKHFWSKPFLGNRKDFDNSLFDGLLKNLEASALFLHRRKTFENIFEVSRKSVDIIYHADLNIGNVIISGDDDFCVIDWMDWGFLKIGMGVSLYDIGVGSNDFIDSEVVFNCLRRVCSDDIKCSWLEFVCNFVIFNFLNYNYFKGNPCSDRDLIVLLDFCEKELLKEGYHV